MIEGPGRQALIGSAVFALCMALLLFLRLLPLSSGMVGWPGPDIAVCLVFAWVLRRPDQLAAPVIVAAFLVEDIFLLRPLGLWTALVLIATEAARLREHRWREQAFMIEWLPGRDPDWGNDAGLSRGDVPVPSVASGPGTGAPAISCDACRLSRGRVRCPVDSGAAPDQRVRR